jgi:large subunit ribosomal protein L21
MFAVIKTGGKQYKVQEGDVLVVEKLGLDEGQKITFDQVLLVDDEEETLVGTPYLQNALVKGEIIENFKDKKVIVFKKKRRKQYKKKRGHRQELTRIRIEEIVSELKAARKKEPAKPEVKKAPLKAKVKEAKPKEIKKEKPSKPEKAKAKDAKKVKKKAGAAKTVEAKAKASTKKKATAKAAPPAKKSKKKMKE